MLYRYLTIPLRAAGLALLLIIAVASCSTNQDTFTSNIFHNTTAHYNGFFYAKEKAREVEKIILKSLDDDHNEILRLYPKLDTTLAKSYSKDTEEIVKMASISIQRHPNSKWVDDNYLMVGLARLYACDFHNAKQTFKYVNTKSQDVELRHRALIMLLRTFTEEGEYEKAEETAAFLEKENRSKHTSKLLYLEKAYLYQVRGDYNHMVQNLTLADSLLMRQDRKSRIYFIIGQVYQKLGFNAEAYNYYRKCLTTNPDYEIDFFAKLNMAQVARFDDKKDLKTIRSQFEKLLADEKNRDFRDKIYFEMGEFERKQNILDEAIKRYKLSAHAGKSKRIQGLAYLRIGQIYFDQLRKYSLAKSYYDSAVSSLPKEVENYNAYKKRQEVLGDFVNYTETIHMQDSLLKLAGMDSLPMRRQYDSTLLAQAKPEIPRKKKRRGNTGSFEATNQNSSLVQTENPNTTDWYFGNPPAVAIGQSEFQRIWGNITLEDNWRRSARSAPIQQELAVTSTNPTAATQDPAEARAKQAEDNFRKLYSQLPRTAKQKEEAYGKIEMAYFNLGDLYYFQLEEKDNASITFETLLNRFPKSTYAPEVLYKLYLIARENGSDKAAVYARQLEELYPNSTFTKIMLNPNYLKENSVAAEKQKLLYKEAYELYQNRQLVASSKIIDRALAVGETNFTSQLELLKILITGKTEDVTRYQFELEEFGKKFPDSPLKAQADLFLAASKSFVEKSERAKGIRFTRTLDQPHRFVILYKREFKISEDVTRRLEAFNARNFKSLKLETSNLPFNDDYVLTFVTDIPDKKLALEYQQKVSAELVNTAPLSSYKFDIFVITRENFNTFYRTKALDEYFLFFERNYQQENQ
ncbi:MAG: tetratricopeptide repeat protein [Cyclobacteriaceae bacterium]